MAAGSREGAMMMMFHTLARSRWAVEDRRQGDRRGGRQATRGGRRSHGGSAPVAGGAREEEAGSTHARGSSCPEANGAGRTGDRKSRKEGARRVMPSFVVPDACSPSRAPFWGHVVVFTGKLACLTRRQAQAKVRELGGDTAADVTHRTTMLVVGDEGFLTKIDTSRKLRT